MKVLRTNRPHRTSDGESRLPKALATAVGMTLAVAATAAEMEVVEVVATVPAGAEIETSRVPANVQSTSAEDFQRFQSLDLADHMNRTFNSVNINAAQNNPLQMDVQVRGFTASPLLGLAQGLSVYQNGARINGPLGDEVNWDLLPESAVNRMTLFSGANPLYGLNTLGGGLSIEMKNGFNFEGTAAELSGGSFGRRRWNGETGGNNGTWGWYFNLERFDENGWRDLSDSDATNIYSAGSYRTEQTEVDLSFQYGESFLTGNGASPIGLLQLDRAAVFTAPDITENQLFQTTLNAKHELSDAYTLVGNLFLRKLKSRSFNGDGSDFIACGDTNTTGGLFQVDEDDLDAAGIDDDDIAAACGAAGVNNEAAFVAILNGLSAPGTFTVADVELLATSGNGALSGDAINNRSTRDQLSYGTDIQLAFDQMAFGMPHQGVVGFAFFHGKTAFDSTLELSEIDPDTRSTEGQGTGTFVDDEATDVATRSRTLSLFLSDTIGVTDRLDVTLGLRYNNTRTVIADQSGIRPELNGSHTFQRFNPSLGATYAFGDASSVYGSYSESSRAPTPIELSCNEEIFRAAGGNADEVCRLPNAFLADPPLEQVVAKGFEFGTRGLLGYGMTYHLGYYRITNTDDILFQTADIGGQGLFDQVDKTRRTGIEAALAGEFLGIDWFANYSYVRATFESPFNALSPEHDFADANGRIQVNRGDRIPGVPAHQFKFGGDYNITERLRFGGDVMYNSGQFLRGDESNQLETIDGYALLNLRATFEVTKNVEFFARVNNVLDTDYESFGLLGENPNEIDANAPFPLANDTPRYLGAGAPRAGFVGMRINL